MARDDEKLLFSSAWETDQIFKDGEVQITVPASSTLETTVETFTALDGPPWMDFTYRLSGGDFWWQPGFLTINPTTSDFEGVAGYWHTTTTSAVVGLVNGATSAKTVTVRYKVFSDVMA